MNGDGRAPLNRDRILRGAIELADSSGLEALSMRRLAQHLGYEAMSLYNHVQNKDDLLDGVVDLVAGDIDGPPADLDWKPAIRHYAVSAHRTLLAHPWTSGLWPTRWPGPNRFAHMELLLARLAEADLPEDLADVGFHAITLHIAGFTQQQLTYAAIPDPDDEMLDRLAREIPPREFPHMTAHIRYHLEHERTIDEFEFVLDLILDGLERAAS